MRYVSLIIGVVLIALFVGACGCPDCGTVRTDPTKLEGEMTLTANVNAGGSVTLPLRGTVNVTIDWGDGASSTCPTRITEPGDVTCEYTTGGDKNVTISRATRNGPWLTQFGSGAATYPNVNAITGVSTFGSLGLQSLSGAFHGNSNPINVPSELPASVIDTSYMFAEAINFNQDLSDWDTSGITTMYRMFYRSGSFNNGCEAGVDCPLNWAIGETTNVDEMFDEASAFGYASTLFGAKDPNRLTLDDYAGADISGVDASNLEAINDLLSNLGANAQADDAALQALVDAYAALTAVVNGESEGLTEAQLTTLGLTDLTTAPSDARQALFDSALKPPRDPATVDTFEERHQLADIVNRIISSADTNTRDETLTKNDLDRLGINTQSITDANIAAIQQAIANASVESVSTLTGLQNVIDAAINGDAVITTFSIGGVTPPVAGETPATTISETDQYTGTITWSPSDATFQAGETYTATITLTPKSGYTLFGVAANSFTVADANSVTHAVDSGVITATFSGTATTITTMAIGGVTPPVAGETPATTISETDQYTGTITWSPSDATFQAGETYTATITLTPKSGYTLFGVAANSFTVADANSATHAVDSGVITATFPTLASLPSVLGGTFSPVAVTASAGATASSAAVADGAVIVTGEFSGTATFTPAESGSPITLTAQGGTDAYVAKLNSSGQYLWATRAGGTGNDAGVAVAVQSDGSAIVTGRFENSVTFGATTLTSAGLNDAFAAKIDTNGNWAWAIQTSGAGKQYGIAIAATTGGAIVAGYTEPAGANAGDISFPGITGGFTNSAGIDGFVAKIADNGTTGSWVWARRIGNSSFASTSESWPNGLTVAADGSALITGWFSDKAIYSSPGQADLELTSAGDLDAFIAKIDSSGNWQWVTRTGGTSRDRGIDLAATNDGSTYFIGHFQDVTIPAGDTANNTAINLGGTSGNNDIIVGRLNPSGKWIWAKRVTGPGNDTGSAITAAADGTSAIATGEFRGTVSLTGLSSLTSTGDSDVFIAKIDSSGNWQWATRAGGTGADSGKSVAMQSDGSAIVTGNYTSPATFGDCTLTKSGSGSGAFVAFITSAGELSCSLQSISALAVAGVTPPAAGATPVAAVTETAQYTGSVTWSPTPGATFAPGTSYTATITLTPKGTYSPLCQRQQLHRRRRKHRQQRSEQRRHHRSLPRDRRRHHQHPCDPRRHRTRYRCHPRHHHHRNRAVHRQRQLEPERFSVRNRHGLHRHHHLDGEGRLHLRGRRRKRLHRRWCYPSEQCREQRRCHRHLPRNGGRGQPGMEVRQHAGEREFLTGPKSSPRGYRWCRQLGRAGNRRCGAIRL